MSPKETINCCRRMNEECTIVVASCDKYADLLRPFSVLWRKYWPDCPFETALVTETPPSEKGLCFNRVIACGLGKCWSEMMAEALRQISTPYVILLMDDYLLDARVDTERILSRLAQMKTFNAANLRLIPNPKGGTAFPNSDLFEYCKNTAYCVSCQVGFWARDYFLGLVERTKSAWEFEREGSFMVADEPRPILHTPTREFPFVDAVHKGCWEKFGVKVLADNGIAYDFSKRGLPPFKARLVEGLKGLIFRLVPTTLLVRIQNAFSLGAKEKH